MPVTTRVLTVLLTTLVLATLAATGCAHSPPAAPPPSPPGTIDELADAVKTRLKWTGTPFRVKIAGERIHAEMSLPRFYKLHSYRAAWLTLAGALPLVEPLLHAVAESAGDGLLPSDFHQAAIQTLLEDLSRRKTLGMPVSLDRLVDLELLLTDSYLTLGNQLQSGKVKPRMPGYEWFIPRTDHKDIVTVLEGALPTAASPSGAIAESLHDLQSHEPRYWQLRQALADYRAIAKDGGWKLITPGPSLHRGDHDPRVPLLRKRLLSSHDAPGFAGGVASDPRELDEQVETALKKFQRRHGLEPDGSLGAGTLKALNVSAPHRVRQLEINLERWRWLPRELGPRYLAVNIAGFSLRVVEQNKVVLTLPVVVGNQYRHTPVFTGLMDHVILNPSWFVPAKIAIEDLLPKVQKDPDYLNEHGFTVLRRERGKGLVEVDATEIDWKKLDDTSFGYVLRQEPGEANSLGQVKFTFPNRFNVYLHDTPAKDLFRKRVRSFSSGCIRVQRPLELLSYVLAKAPEWTPERIHDELAAEKEKSIELPEPLPVELLYETSWVDETGEVNFRPDVYGQDELLDQYL